MSILSTDVSTWCAAGVGCEPADSGPVLHRDGRPPPARVHRGDLLPRLRGHLGGSLLPGVWQKAKQT